MIPHVLCFKRDVHDSNSLYISYDNQFIVEFGALEDKKHYNRVPSWVDNQHP